MNKLSKDRDWYINLAFCLFSFLGLFIVPVIISGAFKHVIKNTYLTSILGSVVLIMILTMFYYKDLKQEFKIFKNNFSKCFRTGLRYYIVGILGMVVTSLIVTNITGGTSANENSVRELLVAYPVFMFINISIIAPLSEELIFRKSISPLIKNKWFRAITSGILFGMAHLLTGDAIKLVDLLFIFPYGSLGFVFSLMDYDTNTTFTSITYHALHNTMTGILLLLISSMGVAI